jgi:hypothetical protein
VAAEDVARVRHSDGVATLIRRGADIEPVPPRVADLQAATAVILTTARTTPAVALDGVGLRHARSRSGANAWRPRAPANN